MKRVFNLTLTSCTACAKEISTLADKCPNCGAPNEWVHPHIRIFMADMPQNTSKKYFVFHNKTQIWGNTEKKFPWWMWIIIIFCSAPGFAFGFIPGLIIAPIAYYLLLNMYGNKLEFFADFQKGTWTSNDDSFWKPIRSKLDI